MIELEVNDRKFLKLPTYDRLLTANDWDKEELKILEEHKKQINRMKTSNSFRGFFEDYSGRSNLQNFARDICIDYALYGPEKITFDLASIKKYGMGRLGIGVFFGTSVYRICPQKEGYAYYFAVATSYESTILSKFLLPWEREDAVYSEFSHGHWNDIDHRDFDLMLSDDPNMRHHICEDRAKEIASGIVEYLFDLYNQEAYSKTINYGWRNNKLRATLLDIVDKGIFYSYRKKESSDKYDKENKSAI